MKLSIASLAILVCLLDYGVTTLNAGVIAAWHFDEVSGSTAFPAAGAVNGSLTGDAAFVPGGVSGGAVAMSTGGGGFVTMGDNFSLSGNSNFSLVAWIKLNNGDTNGYLVAGRHHATVVAGYFLGVNNTGSGSGEVSGGGIYYQAYPNPVSTDLGVNNGGWHQLVGVHDAGASEARLYVDGVLRDTRTLNAFSSPGADFAVGGILNPAGTLMTSSLTGTADEVSLWDQALTSAEVRFLFDNPGALPEPASSTLLGGMSLVMWAWSRQRRQISSRTY